jgi:hypothetical protein
MQESQTNNCSFYDVAAFFKIVKKVNHFVGETQIYKTTSITKKIQNANLDFIADYQEQIIN